MGTGCVTPRRRLAWAYFVRGDAGALHSRGLLGVAKCGGTDRGIGDQTQTELVTKTPKALIH